MKTKSTDRDVLMDGLQKMGLTIVLLFVGPTLIYIAFSNQEKMLYIPILVVGILICCGAVYLGFKGINTILDSMFKSNKTR